VTGCGAARIRLLADCIRLATPQPTEWQRIGNQIEAVTAGLQKVSAQVEMSRTAPQMVVRDQ
jgi:hypothetical protein